MRKLKISKPSYFAAASIAAMKKKASDNFYRWNNGVLIEPIKGGGIFIVATDGFKMAVFHNKGGYANEQMILPMSNNLFKATKYYKGCEDNNFRIEVEEDNLFRVLDDTGGEGHNLIHCEEFKPIDANYPDWRKVIPEEKKVKPKTDKISCFDPDKIGAFGRMATVAFGNYTSSIRIIDYGLEEKPSLIVMDKKEWFGVLMPLRDEGVGWNIPFELHKDTSK